MSCSSWTRQRVCRQIMSIMCQQAQNDNFFFVFLCHYSAGRFTTFTSLAQCVTVLHTQYWGQGIAISSAGIFFDQLKYKANRKFPPDVSRRGASPKFLPFIQRRACISVLNFMVISATVVEPISLWFQAKGHRTQSQPTVQI